MSQTPVIPNLPLLNEVETLRRMRNKEAIYLRALDAFFRDTPPLAATLPTEWPSDPNQARINLHSLKGMAATIGAEQLAEITRQMEYLMREETPDTALYPQLLALFGPCLHATLALAQTRLSQPQTNNTSNINTAPHTPLNVPQLQTQLTNLTELLQQSNLKALTVFDNVSEQLAFIRSTQQHNMIDALDHLSTAMNEMDFSAAQNHCKRLQDYLGEM